jgi:imidazole glycerol phosphate synthase glutamine amidotransferase subunit
MTEIVIIPTGTANLASVKAAFRRLGASPVVDGKPERVASASHVMLPGVGAFGAAMAELVKLGLIGPLKQRIAADRPTICICVGHQLLFRGSEENPGIEGLSVIDADVGRYPDNVRTPQFGWNRVMPAHDMQMIDEGYAYFANSYRAERAPGFRVAHAEHGGIYVAAVERGNVIGCQFHPELSHDYGQALLARFLELGGC